MNDFYSSLEFIFLVLPGVTLATGNEVQNPTVFEQTLSNLETLLTIAAIIFGGAWAYFHYFKGRIYKLRSEVNVSGQIITHDQHDYLVVNATLKNVGLSEFRIDKRATALSIFTLEDEQTIVNMDNHDDYYMIEGQPKALSTGQKCSQR